MSVRATISLLNFRHNILQLIAHCEPGVLFSPSLKANAYGHGLKECVKALATLPLAEKSCLYGVGLARVSEILELRNAGILDRIVLYSHATRAELNVLFSSGFSHKPKSADHVCGNVEFVVGSEHYLRDIVAIAGMCDGVREVRIHLKCDTGMGRVGVPPEQFAQLYYAACAIKGVSVVGVCTHFSATDDETVHRQWAVFSSVLDCVKERKDALIIHAANSGSVLWAEKTHCSMVRPGIALYGANPQPPRLLPSMVSLRPVMKVTSHVACVKKVPKNHGISYLSTYKTLCETHIAVVNAGYGDGISLNLSNCGMVRIREKNYSIIGRVCMDMFMVDLGQNDCGVKPNDEVLLWGDAALSVDKQASLAKTISYDFLCSVGNNYRVEKVFLE